MQAKKPVFGRLKHRLCRLRDCDVQPLVLLIALMVASFLMGGSSRTGVASLIVLRPLAIMIGAVGLMGLRWEQVYHFRWAFGLAAAIVIMFIAEMIPLPSAIYANLPGRGLIIEIDKLAGNVAWRPMSVAPLETWDSLMSLAVPLAALVLVVQLDDKGNVILLKALLIIGLATIGIGLLQIWGDPQGPLYLYEMARGNGDSTGFFANKNHQAIFIASLIPMSFAYRSIDFDQFRPARMKIISYTLIGFCIVTVPILLVTNSRTGFILGVFVILACLYTFRLDRRVVGMKNRWGAVALLFGGIVVFSAAILSGRALAWSRLVALSPIDDLRYKVLPLVRDGIFNFLPWGAGGGSFQTVYIWYEPNSLLSPTIMNQVHNDWLDIPLAYGIPGLVIISSATIVLAWSGLRTINNGLNDARSVMGRVAFLGLALFGMGSITDYPLRTGALEVEFVIFVVWLLSASSPKSQTTIGSLTEGSLSDAKRH